MGVEIKFINGCKCLVNTLSWDEIKYLVLSNQLGQFARSYSEALRYKQQRANFKKQHVSSYKRLVCLQLKWAPEEYFKDPKILDSDIVIALANAKLFADPSDYEMSKNEFPYNFEASVSHLLLWTKVPILSDPASEHGDLTAHTRHVIDEFIEKHVRVPFGIDKENITWFRNWTSLQSIPLLSHVHILIKGLSDQQAFIDKFNSNIGSKL